MPHTLGLKYGQRFKGGATVRKEKKTLTFVDILCHPPLTATTVIKLASTLDLFCITVPDTGIIIIDTLCYTVFVFR